MPSIILKPVEDYNHDYATMIGAGFSHHATNYFTFFYKHAVYIIYQYDPHFKLYAPEWLRRQQDLFNFSVSFSFLQRAEHIRQISLKDIPLPNIQHAFESLPQASFHWLKDMPQDQRTSY